MNIGERLRKRFQGSREVRPQKPKEDFYVGIQTDEATIEQMNRYVVDHQTEIGASVTFRSLKPDNPYGMAPGLYAHTGVSREEWIESHAAQHTYRVAINSVLEGTGVIKKQQPIDLKADHVTRGGSVVLTIQTHAQSIKTQK